MKILIIWGMPLIEKNAQTTCLIEKLENLIKLNNEVSYLAPKIPIFLWKNKRINNVLILALYQIPFFFNIFWNIIKYKPDIIHSSSPLVLISGILAKTFKIPHVIEAHGILYEDANMTNKSKIMISLLKKIEKISYKNSDRIIANANGTKEFIEKEFDIGTNKVVFVPNGANIDLFKPIKIDKVNLGLSNKFIYLCYIGNLEIWQGISNIIKCADIVLEKFTSVRFLIIGDGPIKENLINETINHKISDKFIFTGSIPYEDVPKYINASEICLAPFVKWKNDKMSPLKIFEYMACGKPVITSDIKGSGDIIRKSKSGIVVNPENRQEFADSIINLLNDDKQRRVFGENGRNYVINHYSWLKIAVKMMEIYKNISNVS